jgi:hypothetical protein
MHLVDCRLKKPGIDDPAARLAIGVRFWVRYAHENPTIGRLVVGATVSAMWMVLEGHQTWREAGSPTAQLLLGAMGIEPAEARGILMAELPRLATA